MDLSELLVVGIPWAYVAWLTLQHISKRWLQNLLLGGTLLAALVRLFVSYYHLGVLDMTSTWVYIIALLIAIIICFCSPVRLLPNIPMSSRMRNEPSINPFRKRR